MTTKGVWISRFAIVCGGYGAVIAGCRISNIHVAAVVLAAAFLAAAALWWFLADSAGTSYSGGWSEPAQYEAPAVRNDPATSYLRRLCDEAGPGVRRASPNAPRTLQTIVRELTEQRVDQRPLRGLPTLNRLPPVLADYLFADPPPRPSQQQLARIITSIEEL